MKRSAKQSSTLDGHDAQPTRSRLQRSSSSAFIRFMRDSAPLQSETNKLCSATASPSQTGAKSRLVCSRTLPSAASMTSRSACVSRRRCCVSISCRASGAGKRWMMSFSSYSRLGPATSSPCGRLYPFRTSHTHRATSGVFSMIRGIATFHRTPIRRSIIRAVPFNWLLSRLTGPPNPSQGVCYDL